MSLVEKAIQKIQATRSTPGALVNQPVAVKAAVGPSPDAGSGVGEFDPASLRADATKLLHVDFDALRERQMLPAKSEERQVAGQFRAIKRPLLEYVATEDANPNHHLIVVASALPADGKTFTALNLALSLALEKDLHVLLVDGDAPKRDLTRALGLESAKGMLDVLAEEQRSIEEVIVPTDVPQLDFLPLGGWRETATELYSSDRMRQVVQRLASMYHRGIVLFDSPPVLLANESRSLGAIAGQILLVVKAGVTPQQAVKDAVEALGTERRISLMLNNADLSGVMGYYYGYGYGYGHPYGTEK